MPSRWSISLICESPFGRCPRHFDYAACKGEIRRKPALFPCQQRNLLRRAFPRLRDFKAWNGFHDLLIKISSDLIVALESKPRRKDKAADRAALLLNAGRH
jgi:hypothetical protein